MHLMNDTMLYYEKYVYRILRNVEHAKKYTELAT